jgi:hypothetical protein
MTNDHEQLTRELAHHIWESEGCPQGEELRHWQMAERLLEASAAKAPTASANPAKRSSRAGGKRPAKTTAPTRRRNPTPKESTP